ncbi:uncharacterized protein LOC135491029 isoform X2 [Lineus longissimus]|uniref:uncharacterized protein LOC135491029 isoform X2 n=1 Tax=Lineus longissimus TaxID=88925 RepID=UPI00315D1BD9
MSGANICDTEKYKSASGLFETCSNSCGTKNENCKTFCKGIEHDARGPNPEEMRRLTNENQEQDSQGPEGQGTHSDSQQPPTTQSGSSERRAVPGCPQQNPGDPSADELGEGDPYPGNIEVPPTPSTDAQPSTTPQSGTLERGEVHEYG